MKNRLSLLNPHNMKICLSISTLLFSLLSSTSAWADIEITMFDLTPNGKGQIIGTVIASDTEAGLLLKPELAGLPPGLHGFHIHQNKSCEDEGNAAGGHFDPANSSNHLGPYGLGHLGDLPALYVDTNGKANLEVIAPRLAEKDIHSHSLMIHAGGDNYSDEPEPLGGGGQRIACGIINHNH